MLNLRTVFLVVKLVPNMSIARVGLPQQRPTADLVAKRARIFCKGMEENAVH